jgi:multidrug efflux pump subunit AcrA (membrane-fusion protein)
MSGQNKSRYIAASCLIGAGLLLSGCAKKAASEEAEAPTPVTVETAVRGAIDHVISADAVLYPINQANVTSKISAPIKRVLVNRGDHVTAGKLLMELEGTDLTAAAEESKQQYETAQAAYQTMTGATVAEDRTKAESDVKSAEQALDAAKRVYDNRVTLQKEGALAAKMVDDARVALVQAQSACDNAKRHLDGLNKVSQQQAIRSAQAQMGAAKAHYDTAAAQVVYTEIRSPINGIVADRPLYPGEMPASGSPLITIVDIHQIVARANLPVKEVAAIKVGVPARLAGPNGDIPGKVTVVSPAVDPNTTTVEVWVQADNPGEKLKPGGTVRVSIIAETIQNTIVVPATALLNADDGGQKVMVVTSDNKAHERRIAVGVRQGARVQIISGVQEGEQVVTSGGLGLEDKAKVVVQQPKPEEDEDENADEGAPEASAKAATGAKGKDAKDKKE